MIPPESDGAQPVASFPSGRNCDIIPGHPLQTTP
ncbi:hypothetical protein F0726_00074 [Acidithiobacillus caldus]|nr:hypothetical protein F0726_00074 [Acidithiobacillus caldus]